MNSKLWPDPKALLASSTCMLRYAINYPCDTMGGRNTVLAVDWASECPASAPKGWAAGNPAVLVTSECFGGDDTGREGVELGGERIRPMHVQDLAEASTAGTHAPPWAEHPEMGLFEAAVLTWS